MSKVQKVVPWIPVIGQAWSLGMWIKDLVQKRKKAKFTDAEREQAQREASDRLDKILKGAKDARR